MHRFKGASCLLNDVTVVVLKVFMGTLKISEELTVRKKTPASQKAQGVHWSKPRVGPSRQQNVAVCCPQHRRSRAVWPWPPAQQCACARSGMQCCWGIQGPECTAFCSEYRARRSCAWLQAAGCGHAVGTWTSVVVSASSPRKGSVSVDSENVRFGIHSKYTQRHSEPVQTFSQKEH